MAADLCPFLASSILHLGGKRHWRMQMPSMAHRGGSPARQLLPGEGSWRQNGDVFFCWALGPSALALTPPCDLT